MTMPSKVTGWKPKGGTVYFYDPDPDWLAKQSSDEIDVIHMVSADIAEDLARALEEALGWIGSERDGYCKYDNLHPVLERYNTATTPQQPLDTHASSV